MCSPTPETFQSVSLSIQLKKRKEGVEKVSNRYNIISITKGFLAHLLQKLK